MLTRGRTDNVMLTACILVGGGGSGGGRFGAEYLREQTVNDVASSFSFPLFPSFQKMRTVIGAEFIGH